MEAEIQCDVSENQGKLGLAISQQKPGKKHGFSFSIQPCQHPALSAAPPSVSGREGTYLCRFKTTQCV